MCRKNLQHLILLQFHRQQSQYHDATLKDLRKVLPNIRHASMWSNEVQYEVDAEIVNNCWRMARILLATWNVDFALVDVREKNKMRKELDELGALHSKLPLGNDEISIRTSI